VFEAAVVGAFGIRRETAGRQLPLREVIREAVATDALFGTTAIGAIATSKIRFFFTIHSSPFDVQFFPRKTLIDLIASSSATPEP
jgi:hypothetical protein